MRSYLIFLRDNATWLGAGLALSLLSTFGQTAFVSVFAADIAATHGLGQGGWGAIYAAGTTLSAAVMVWAGGLADRVALPRLAAIMLLGLAASCTAMTVAPVWALIPVVLGLRLFGQGMLSHIAYVAMARWFTAGRGRAVALVAVGFALGQSSLPLGFTTLLASGIGSTALWLASAAACLLAIWPVTRLMARPRAAAGQEAAGDDAPGLGRHHWTRAEVLRTGVFWALVPALIAPPAFGTAFFFFQTHLPEVKGWSQVGFVALFPLVFAGSVATAIATGALVDRIGAARLLPWALLPMAAGFVWLAWAPSLVAAVPAALLLALTQGAMQVVPVAMWAELFGTRHIGAVKAAAVAIAVLGTAVGPGLCGALIDRGIDFPAQMPGIAGYILGAAALAAMALSRGRTARLAARGATLPA